jgi:hypothetical protein
MSADLRRVLGAAGKLTWRTGAATLGAITAVMIIAAGTADATTVPPYKAICSGSCHWERLRAPPGLALDVKGQVAAPNTPLIAYQPAVGDPAADFTAAADAMNGTVKLRYTPYGTLTNAEALAHGTGRTEAEAAYSSDGTPRYCATVTSAARGAPLVLRACAASINQWQDFNPVVKSGYVQFQTFATGVGSSIMALNDKGYGGDGSPIINWPAGDDANEFFSPAVSA